MYVSRLRVDGVRGFHGERRVDLDFARPDGSHAGWTVLAGRNGSGKTTLLRALAMAFLNEKHGSLTGGPEAWSAASRSDPLIAVDMVAERFRATCRIGAGKSTGEPALRWCYDVHTPIDPSSVPVDFCAGYGPHRRLTGGTVEVPGSAVSAQRVATLFQEGAALGESVAWLIQQHLRRLEGRSGAQELIDAVFALLGDGLLPDDYRVVRVDSEGLWVRRGGREFPLREMSDGYRTVTAVVVDLLRHLQLCYGELPLDTSGDVPAVPLPGVVLIDEMDGISMSAGRSGSAAGSRRTSPGSSSSSPPTARTSASRPTPAVSSGWRARTSRSRRAQWARTSTGGSCTAAVTTRCSPICSGWTALTRTGPRNCAAELATWKGWFSPGRRRPIRWRSTSSSARS